MKSFGKLAAIVITAFYKGRLRANCMIEDKYMALWKSFKEMENFTLIYAAVLFLLNMSQRVTKARQYKKPIFAP